MSLKIKKLSSDLIAVFLSEQDIIEYDIDISDKIPRSDELHRFLFEIMEVVREETGFDPYHGGQVVVEASPTSTGLNLLISKIKTKKKSKMTRERFEKVKKVSVVNRKDKDKESMPEEYLKHLIEELGLGASLNKNKKEEPENRVFIFSTFKEWEDALCRLNSDLISDFCLYRSEAGYALITNLTKENVYYNMLSEFAVVECTKDITVMNIKEAWTFIAGGRELAEMCEAVKAMQ